MTPRIRLDRLDLLFPSYVLLAVIALWLSGTGWLGEWQWTLDNVNGSTVLLGPYAASAAAWQVVSTQANDVLYSSAARGWAVPLRTGVGVFASAGLAWLVVAASGLIGTAVVVHGGPAPLWVLVAGPIVLIACIAVGIAVGHWWPSRIGALLVAPVLFVLGGLGASGHLPDLLHQGPGTATLAGLRWDPANFCLEMTALLLFATTLVLLSTRRRGLLRPTSLALPLVPAAAFVGVLMLISAAAPERFLSSDEQPTSCAAHAPMICVPPSNVHALASWVDGFAHVVPAAQELGLDLPSSFRSAPSDHGGEDWGSLITYADANDAPTADQVVMSLVTPGDCAAYYDPDSAPPEIVNHVQLALATMIADVSKGNRKALHDPAMLSWAQRAYRDLRTCRLADLKPPPGIS